MVDVTLLTTYVLAAVVVIIVSRARLGLPRGETTTAREEVQQ
jgi:hypothetical protein